MPKKIAIVEDEAELAALIEYNLVRHGYEAQLLGGSKGTLRALEQARPDLILLDVMLPDLDGFELCRQIRQSSVLGRTPVLFLTARSDEVDRVLGLEIGGDDYMTKPFSPRELIARVKRTCAAKRWMPSRHRRPLVPSASTAQRAACSWESAKFR
jgi:DNA-binding response OmpR family regulator